MSGADDQRAAEPDQCRYCPNDADRDEAGHLYCIECGWTDSPGKIVGLHETIDRLRAEFQQGWREGADWQRARIREAYERAKDSDYHREQLEEYLRDDEGEQA